MRISKAGLLATAGFLILFAAGIIEAVLDGMNAQPWLGLLIYAVSILAGVGLLWHALDIKQREDRAAGIATDAARRRQARESVPAPCELCYANAARVRCREHDLLICIYCCAQHDSGFRCTLYLTESGDQVVKARA